jgi:hypothetical protein
MRDGDEYACCCSCGTEFLTRTMHLMTASGIWQCHRCFLDQYAGVGDVDEDFDYPTYEDWQ